MAPWLDLAVRILEEDVIVNAMGFVNNTIKVGRNAHVLNDDNHREMCPLREVRSVDR